MNRPAQKIALLCIASILIQGCASTPPSNREDADMLRILKNWNMTLVRTSADSSLQLIDRSGAVLGHAIPCTEKNEMEFEQCRLKEPSALLIDPDHGNARGVLLFGKDVVVTDITKTSRILHEKAQGGDFLLFSNGTLLEIATLRTTGSRAPEGRSVKLLEGQLIFLSKEDRRPFRCERDECLSLLEQNPVLVRQGTVAWKRIRKILLKAEESS